MNAVSCARMEGDRRVCPKSNASCVIVLDSLREISIACLCVLTHKIELKFLYKITTGDFYLL